ncbi:TadE/TadG family type IV pilus assembly protein (plasmid) [Klebsiella sp. WOUb02]|uniref:TadE/TadG family type IV pilus assembly protein n=1 Tax=Klebsiella sp. WOUb02 TaxID=3161071 RepID=UPI003CF4BEA1
MSRIKRFLKCRRAVIAAETALAFPMVLAIGTLCADIYTIVLEREHMEQRAGAIASVLGYQSELTTEGLQGLLDSVLPDEGLGNYQLLISNVRQTGKVYWQLNRGNSTDLCENGKVAADNDYPGELPERDEDDGSDNVSMVVVELCRQGSDISLLGGMSLSGLLQASTINRAAHGLVALDKTLAAEAGLEEKE